MVALKWSPALRLAFALLLLTSAACGGGGGGGGAPALVSEAPAEDPPAAAPPPAQPPPAAPPEAGNEAPQPPPAPATRIYIARWMPSPSPNVEGYLLAIGTSPGTYTTEIDIPIAAVVVEADGTLAYPIELSSDTQYYLAMRAYEGNMISAYSNEIVVPALIPPAAARPGDSADGGRAFIGMASGAGSTAGAASAGTGGTTGEPGSNGSGAEAAGSEEATADPDLTAADLHFALDWAQGSDLDLAVTTPASALVDLESPVADGCAFGGDHRAETGAGHEQVACASPAIGPYMLVASSRAAADAPATLRVFERGVEVASLELLVPANGELVYVHELALSGTGCDRTSVGRRPLSELAGSSYLGFEGGLYPGGENEPPQAHLDEGMARAAAIEPLDDMGNPAAAGAVVVLSLGVTPSADMASLHDAVVIADGTDAGEGAGDWVDAGLPSYDRVRDDVLASAGVTEAQVRVVWLALGGAEAQAALPAPNADAVGLLGRLGDIVRAAHARYPNLELVLVSDRPYAGYARKQGTAEPAAYESAFAAKWLVEAQIHQMSGGEADAFAGNLDWNDTAPWIGWGPELWADGLTPRADGLVWACEDMGPEGTRASASGESKLGELLLDFLHRSPVATPWAAR